VRRRFRWSSIVYALRSHLAALLATWICAGLATWTSAGQRTAEPHIIGTSLSLPSATIAAARADRAAEAPLQLASQNGYGHIIINWEAATGHSPGITLNFPKDGPHPLQRRHRPLAGANPWNGDTPSIGHPARAHRTIRTRQREYPEPAVTRPWGGQPEPAVRSIRPRRGLNLGREQAAGLRDRMAARFPDPGRHAPVPGGSPDRPPLERIIGAKDAPRPDEDGADANGTRRPAPEAGSSWRVLRMS
jgi:hypothetical protein